MTGDQGQEIFKQQAKAMRWVLFTGALVMLIKFSAYFLTHSQAIFSDALESIINLVAGAFALFSIYYAAQPRDENHPYGHGKIEFFAAGFEGAMILVAGIGIILKSAAALLHQSPVHELGLGMGLTLAAGLMNYLLGRFLLKKGKKLQSITLEADGLHLLSDTYSSLALLGGLLLIQLTGLFWLDSVLAILFALFIIFTGYKLLRKSLAGLMDEVDEQILKQIETLLNNNRKEEWIDVHNLRVLQYGASYHIDCHLTLPWYWSLEQAHQEVISFENIFRQAFPERIELFIHTDPCLPLSCQVCSISSCPQRRHAFSKKIAWQLNRLVKNEKHRDT